MPIFIKNAAGKRKISWVKIIIFPILLIILLFELSIALAPYYKYKEYEQQINNDTLFVASFDSVWNNSEFSEIIKEKTFKEALLKLSEKDSIQLVINLPDSAINLYINGVKIHQTNLKHFEKDIVLNKFNTMQYVNVFSKPLKINSEYATIVKEPIVERQAPKDTVEAALQAYKPDTLLQDPAFLKIELEHNIHLIFEQEVTPKSNEEKAKAEFYKTLEGDKFKIQFDNFIHFKKQEHQPKIIIILPANDLRAIYRALPQKAFVVIKY